MRDIEIDAVIGRIAESQEGCVAHRQLLAAGVGRGAIEHRIRSGRLRPRFRGVYVVAHDAPIQFQDERAAMICVGDGSLLRRRSGIFVWGLFDAICSVPEVSIPGVKRQGPAGITFLSGLSLGPGDVKVFNGFRVASIPRLLLDLSAEGDMEVVARVLNEARVLRRLKDSAIYELLGRTRGCRGHPALTRLLSEEAGTGFTRREAERRMKALIRASGLPEPRYNARVGKREVDGLWGPENVIAEVDGYSTHGTRRAFERDRARDGDLAAAGYVVVRITWRELVDRPEAVVARLAGTLARRARTP